MVEHLGSIHGIPGGRPLRPEQAPTGAKVPEGAAFQEILKQAIDEVNQLRVESDTLQRAYAAGETDNLADVLDATKKADLAFQTLMQVRNKLVEAYDQILQMRI